MRNRIGVMQGRLLPPDGARIQSFPVERWREEFPIARNLGLDLIEWTLDHKEIFKNPILTKTGQAEIENLKEEHQIQVVSVTCDNLMQAPIHKVGPEGVTTKYDLTRLLENFPESGQIILVWPIVDDGKVSNKEELKTLVDIVNSMIQILHDKKILIAFETDFTPQDNFDFLLNFPSDVVGINLDLGNSASYGNSILEDFVLNKNRVFNLHIKDRNYGGATVPLGEGDVPWIDFAEKILPFFDGNLILQCARQSTVSETETIRKYLDFLSLIGFN